MRAICFASCNESLFLNYSQFKRLIEAYIFYLEKSFKKSKYVLTILQEKNSFIFFFEKKKGKMKSINGNDMGQEILDFCAITFSNAKIMRI